MSARVIWQGKLSTGHIGRVVVTPATPTSCATVATEIECRDAMGGEHWVPASQWAGDSGILNVLCAAVLGLTGEAGHLVPGTARPS